MGRSLPAWSDDEAKSDLCLVERGSTPPLAALAADPVDRAEMDEVRALMDVLASESED